MATHAQLTAREISGPLNQILKNLSGSEGREWLDAYNRVNRRENPWLTEQGATQVVSDLLGPATDLCTAPATARFILREHFGNKDAQVKTYLYGFDDSLLNLIEENLPETPLHVRPLKRKSVDQPIRDALAQKQETKFAHIWHAIVSGSLRKDTWYLFYVCVNDVWRAVGVRWFGYDWSVFVFSVGRPGGWDAGDLVASR